MAQLFTIHPENPQARLLKSAASILRDGGILAMPTDACYVLCAAIGNKDTLDRMRRIRGIDDKQLLSLMCRDLAEISTYAQIDNQQYRRLKAGTPGPYVFVLPATKEVPRRLAHPSRKTIGIRVPDHDVARQLIEIHGEPVICSTLQLPGDDEPMSDGEAIRDRLQRQIEGVIDTGDVSWQPTTVIDLTDVRPRLIRAGKGRIDLYPDMEVDD